MGLSGPGVGFVGSEKRGKGLPEVEARLPSRNPSQMSVITVMILRKWLI
jgi:hypothetical protein